MKRHPSLHPLSEHHHHALIQSLLIRRAGELSARERSAALRRQAREFVRFWKKTGRKHFREEEEVLLPAYARHVRLDRDADVMRMLADHAAIRGLIGELEKKLAARQPVEAEITALGRTLRDHVRLEEDRIFPRIEAALGDAELKTLAPHFSRLHGRGTSCRV